MPNLSHFARFHSGQVRCTCPGTSLKKLNAISYFISRTLDKCAYQKINFLISHPKHMLWVLKRTVSLRRFFF